LISRSLLVPKILAIALLIKTRFLYRGNSRATGVNNQALDLPRGLILPRKPLRRRDGRH
jgi:hypothetical protein